MSAANTVQDLNRQRAQKVNQETRSNPQSPYADKKPEELVLSRDSTNKTVIAITNGVSGIAKRNNAIM